MSIYANGIGSDAPGSFYVSAQWDSDEDRAEAIGALFGVALAALSEIDGRVEWEVRPAIAKRGGTFARLTVFPVDESLPKLGPTHRRLVRAAYDRADDQRATAQRRRWRRDGLT